ncbi:phospholipase D-like domain-containing protein [Rhodococcus rhodochrous]|uniref:Phospholipase D-like domain-containing protein n=1 Tax=Rhodococcus rhodochrous TaxID=1829 RepID=A0AAW4XPA4_RHORH|nr:helicase-related protein [Rhodococcus rhodochrous]MCD2115010.1 phospholipase D-like domain-containing protein [Rhodococcus rhodochrous]
MLASEQFIVDNTAEDWKALQYVREWCDISSAIDIATGHFEIGAFLALDGAWQKVDKIRLLIGGETSRATADAIAAALDTSIVVERQTGDAFLTGVDAVVDGIRSGKIEIRVYKPKKFHAKAYITHSKLKVVGSAALVGSSNFTRPGLTQNVELNVRFQGPEVVDLQQWYEEHWDQATPVNQELLSVLEHNARKFTPFEVYAKALHALTADVDHTDKSWETTESVIYPMLAPYQQEAFHSLVEMSRRWNGGFLTDGVGLGKTFVGLMLTEYYAVRHRKNVLIMATKTGQDAVWNPELKEKLPDLFGRFSNVLVCAHTDLTTKRGSEEIEHLTKRADVIIIDEAHNFRNHGRAPTDDNPWGSRWWRMLEVCKGKTVFLLTATPINNSFFDLVHQAELFTGVDADDYFASIGISSLRKYTAELEKPFKSGVPDPAAIAAMMSQDKLFQSIIHQNSRRYAVESSKVTGGSTVVFPETQVPRVVPYEFGTLYSPLFTELQTAFSRATPLFTLPMYYPLAFSNKDDVDTIAENRQRQVVALIRTIFLKRFESSLAAFAGSCLDLSAKVLRWLAVNTKIDIHQEKRLSTWLLSNESTLKAIHDRYRSTLDEVWHEEDLTEEELNELDYNLVGEDYRLQEMIDAAFDDLDQLTRFMDRILAGAGVDDKYLRLRDLLIEPPKQHKKTLDKDVFTPEFRTQQVIVFTEFADTARYLEEQLKKDGLTDVDRIDGTRGNDRYAMIKRFAPFYNKVSAHERTKLTPLRVLISTDVLSEGVNLQDGTLLVNYDIHWNPVRLMQRIGRVDRRMNPKIEAALIKEKPSAKKSRGHIQIRNFLPPDEIETLLTLYNRVQNKTLMISTTLGIPGGKLFDESDIFDDVKVFQAFKDEYNGDIAPIEELRLKWLQLVEDNPGLEGLVERLPDGISTAKTGAPAGVFVCRRIPVLTKAHDDADPEWRMDPGEVQWALRTSDGAERALHTINAAISSEPDTATASFGDKPVLQSTLREFERSETKRLRKETQLPLDAPAPKTICWMEVQ